MSIRGCGLVVPGSIADSDTKTSAILLPAFALETTCGPRCCFRQTRGQRQTPQVATTTYQRRSTRLVWRVNVHAGKTTGQHRGHTKRIRHGLDNFNYHREHAPPAGGAHAPTPTHTAPWWTYRHGRSRERSRKKNVFDTFSLPSYTHVFFDHGCPQPSWHATACGGHRSCW